MLRKFVSGVLVACAVLGVAGCSHDKAGPVTETVTGTNGQVTVVVHQHVGREKFTDDQCVRIITDIAMLQHIIKVPKVSLDDVDDHGFVIKRTVKPSDTAEYEKRIRSYDFDLSDPVEHTWFDIAKPDPFSASLHRQIRDLCPAKKYKEVIAAKKRMSEFEWKI